MKRKVAFLAGVLLLGLGLPAQTTAPRQIISANILGYEINPSAMSAFNGCLPTDTGCTMEVIVCYAAHGAAAGTAPTGCIVLPPNSYDTAVYFERSGGTEVPNGAFSGAVAYAEVRVAAQ